MIKTYVLYHANCTDGTGSKYAAWKHFGDKAEYFPVNYGKPVPDMEPNSVVYIVDFSYPRNVLEELRSVHKQLTVLDHHKTAEEDLRGFPGCVFDMERSGCVMTWEYFHPEDEVPHLLLDVQDRDLWKFERPFSKATHASLQLDQGDMKAWDAYATIHPYYEDMVKRGSTLIRRMEIEVKNSIKKVRTVDFLGYKVGVINANDYASEIGSAIADNKDLNVDFAICYCITNDNQALLSMRSVGDFDVSAIAKKFGGGGHKNASGAKVNLNQLIKLLNGGI